MTDASGRQPNFTQAVTWMVIAALANKGITFIGQVAIAHYLMPNSLGVIAPVLAIGTALSCMAGTGIRTILVANSVDEASRMESQAHTVALLMGIASFLAIIASGILYGWFAKGDVAPWWYFVIFGLYPLFESATMVLTARLQRSMQFKLTGFAMALGAMAGTVCVVLTAWAGLGTVSLLIGWPINMVIQFLLIRRWAGSLPNIGPWSWDLAHRAMVPQCAHAITALASGLPIMLAGAWASPGDLGMYQWASSLTTQVVFLISSNLESVYMADFAASVRGGALGNRWRRAAGRALVIGFVLAGLQAIGLPFVIPWLLPANWGDMSTVIRWTCASSILLPALAVARGALLAIGAARVMAVADITAIVIMLVLLVGWLRPHPEMMPAALAACSVVIGLSVLLFAHRQISCHSLR